MEVTESLLKIKLFLFLEVDHKLFRRSVLFSFCSDQYPKRMMRKCKWHNFYWHYTKELMSNEEIG